MLAAHDTLMKASVTYDPVKEISLFVAFFLADVVGLSYLALQRQCVFYKQVDIPIIQLEGC